MPEGRGQAARLATHCAATTGMLAGVRRLAGAVTDRAPTTSAPSRNTGAATATRPGSSSSSVTA